MNKSGILIVSLDFELFWGMQDCVALDHYRENILGARRAIPQLLELFERHNIHATWATVGYLFARNRTEAQKYFPKQMPAYENLELSTYRCFERGDESREPLCYYAPEIIAEIARRGGQEIASHTFSHYYCREAGQTLEQFEADMRAALAIGRENGYNLTSVVLPRNQCEPEYVQVLGKLGLTAYRDEENDWIHEKISFRPLMRLLRLADVYLPLTGQGGYVPRVEAGVVNLLGSRMYKPYMKPLAFLERMKIHRIKRQMLHAARKGLIFHLWWHPHNVGVRTDFHMRQLEEIFAYYDLLRDKYGMRSLNMREAAEECLHETGERRPGR